MKLNAYRTSLIPFIVIAIGLSICIAAQPAHAGAIRNLPGFTTNNLPRNDDGSTGLVPIGFTLNFFGNNYSSLYVNNNGNVTFDQPLRTFTPFDLTSTGTVIIAAFFGDVDTRNTGSAIVTFGNDVVDGHPAFGVNWDGVGVGYYASQIDKLNKFQLILIDRSDRGAGAFDIEFNYDQIQWETGDASGGGGGLGGFSARVGFSNGTRVPGTFYELPGSAINGAFLDSNTGSGLIYYSFNSAENGRYIYSVRGGVPCPVPAPPACTEEDPCYSLRQEEICPSDATVSQDDINIEPSLSIFCPGAIIGVDHVRQGTFIDRVTDIDETCGGQCLTQCNEHCVAVPLSECTQICLRRCTNGACLQWETKCTILGTQTQCNSYCYDQCSANFDPVTNTSFYVSPCGFTIEDALEIRSSDGACTGSVISTEMLTGAGTATTNVTLPLTPGGYDLCISGRLVQTITVDQCDQPACAVQVPENIWAVLQGVNESIPVSLATNNLAGGIYNISLVRFEDDAHSIPMTLPPFVTIAGSMTNIEVLSEGLAAFDLTATNPQPVGRQVRWPGVIIRAEGPAICEATVGVEISCTTDSDCDDGNPCTIERCAPTDRGANLQGCVLTRLSDGTACNDGNACTQTDTCQAGSCTGANPVTCTADQCNDAGTCDPATGLCSNPDKPDGTVCNDGNACTQTDTCQAGSCTGANPVTCTAPDQCHDAGTCDQSTGICSNPAKPDDTVCNDGNPCSINDMCTGGICGGISACGNGIVDASCGEQCDDGNTISGDGCSADCKTENNPPDCSKAYADNGCLWPPNNKLVPVNILGATDPNGDPVTITITSITSDEPTATALGAGGPKHAPDASGVGTSQAMIRAERSGLKDGRVYEISFTAADPAGFMCMGTVQVNVPHDQSSKSCPAVDSGQKYDATKIN